MDSSFRAAEHLDALLRIKEGGRNLGQRLVGEVNHPVMSAGEGGSVVSSRSTPGNEPFQKVEVRN